MLAMMIPMTVPVSAAPALTMKLFDPITGQTNVTETSPGFNVSGSRVLVSCNESVADWNIINVSTAPGSDSAFLSQETESSVIAQGVWGDAMIQATMSGNTTVSIEKKWGQIDHTAFTGAPGFSPVTWNEVSKGWQGSASFDDTVTGVFYEKDEVNPVTHSHYIYHTLAGVIMNVYLVAGNVAVDMSSGKDIVLNPRMAGYAKPAHVTFSDDSTHLTIVTGVDGKINIGLKATGEEAVQIVVVPTYPALPGGVNIDVVPEITTWDFYTTEAEVVPQVRWAGEKIVLEKNFGMGTQTFTGMYVKFSLENQSVGTLEPLTNREYEVKDSAIWTKVDRDGFASVIVTSSDAGVANVVCGLYDFSNNLINQHYFTVYFLKFESLVIGDVYGKRAGHNSGLWKITDTLTNPWDPTGSYGGTQNPALSDNTTQIANVSQDTLVRARVRGWFTSGNPTYRGAETISGTLLSKPAGRWILPDDWADLAGPNWQQSRLHWDIMCNPDGTVLAANNVLGDYKKGTVLVGKANVVGPFSPGLELMTPLGWEITNAPVWDGANSWDGYSRIIHTVVPDGNLNTWDAPMPPAKIIYQIQKVSGPTGLEGLNQAGFFKATNKADVYYKDAVFNTDGSLKSINYTNPFYQILIPAHPAIPAFINNGGYDWDSFQTSYGNYAFWQFINQTQTAPLVATTDPAGHPTCVEVYSDNHGEAMVWLNGNWNLDLRNAIPEGASVDIQIGTTVGTTQVQATADYPYARVHQAIQSNIDTKTWTWGGQVLGTDAHTFKYPTAAHTTTYDTRMVLSIGTWDTTTEVGSGDNTAAKSAYKMVWVWVTDRDGQRAGVLGAPVFWDIANGTGSNIKIDSDATNGWISTFNTITKNIYVKDGFLSDAAGNSTGSVVPGSDRKQGVSYLRAPTSYEMQLFAKFWGTSPTTEPVYSHGTSTIKADAAKYCVAAIKVTGGDMNYSAQARINITITSHTFDAVVGQAVPGSVSYETNVDTSVVDALDDGIRIGDANCDGTVNMGDVTAVERMILGYNNVTSNAILNDEGSVDMGTVVKIERIILGLN